MKGTARDLAEAGMFPTMRGGEVVEEAKDEMGTKFSKDEIKVDFVKGAHALVGEGVVSSWVAFSFICIKGFLWWYSLIRSEACI